MELFGTEIFGGNEIWIAAAACLCCTGIFILLFASQILFGAFGAIFGGIEIFFEFLSAGPVAWCGCLFVLLGCTICSVIAMTILQISSTCGTETQVNFCRLFG